MPTLYLSDLDGTLLRADQRTSAYTNAVLNRLTSDGMLFSYATARSIHTASRATAGLNIHHPQIVYNGAFIVQAPDQPPLHTNLFIAEESSCILTALLEADVSPIVYCLDDRERMAYNRLRINGDTRAFLDTRPGDLRHTPVKRDADLARRGTFYFTCIDTKEKLAPLYERFRSDHTCMFAKDIYSNAQWLEIMPRTATKAHAARQLADMLGCEKIVAFGDSVNDIPLFEAADECYAVANAVAELKARATGVIASNDEDGVARWLEAQWAQQVSSKE